MRTFTPEQMAEVDRLASSRFGIPGIELMTRAGTACAETAIQLAEPFAFPEFLVLAGKGNNGGDAFIAAKILAERGYPVRCFFPYSPDELSGDAALAYQFLPQALKDGITRTFNRDSVTYSSVIVDGMLGTGFKGTVREPFSEWIRTVNESDSPVLAIDLPSGLNAHDGSAELCVQADITVTMGMHKTGMVLDKGPAHCGRIVLAPIGFPKELLGGGGENGIELFTEYDFRRLYRREPVCAYKNSRGLAVIAGGSANYFGAPFLTAEAALHAGAGLAKVIFPASAGILCAVPPELILQRVPDSHAGFFTADSAAEFRQALAKAAAAAVGPGMGTDERSMEIVAEAVKSGLPCVLDADALNLLAKYPQKCGVLSGKCVLTPHEGEMQRLERAFGLSGSGSRTERALALAEKTHAVVVLKGPGTVTAAPDGAYAINTSGTPLLATAGSGDVLSGIITAFLANGFAPFDAAKMGVFVHGRAAERACKAGTRGKTSAELLNHLTSHGAFA